MSYEYILNVNIYIGWYFDNIDFNVGVSVK